MLVATWSALVSPNYALQRSWTHKLHGARTAHKLRTRLWLVLPDFLLPSSVLESWAPVIFFPSILAALLVVPIAYWWGVRDVRGTKSANSRGL